MNSQEIVLKGIDKQLLESRKIITRFGEIDMDKVGYTAYAYTGKENSEFFSYWSCISSCRKSPQSANN